jgi:energy-coupling factor transport system ATP-binding protein
VHKPAVSPQGALLPAFERTASHSFVAGFLFTPTHSSRKHIVVVSGKKCYTLQKFGGGNFHVEMVKTEKLVYNYIRIDETNEEHSFTALNGIDIHTRRGEFVAVLGRNGSGKSTFAKHINALLLPTKGTVWVNGFDTGKEGNTWEIRRKVGMVFQNPDNQLIAAIVEEDIAFGPENLGMPSKTIRKNVDDALAAVNMSAFSRAEPHKLSGGQKQRVAIAGILAMKPDCIVLDEPTAMLDPSGRREVIDTVMRLNKEDGISVILITHFMEEAVRADRVIVLDKGTVVLDGTPRQVFSHVETMKGLHLDVPMAAEISHRLVTEHKLNLPDSILTIEELITALSPYRPKSPEMAQPPVSHSVTPREPVLEARDLTYVYNPGTVYEKMALDSVNITIRRGEFVGLIGHTGSGKSTLIQTFNALLKPSQGEILLNGENIFADRKKLRSVRQKVGLVFQYPEHQLFEMTVIKDVSFGPLSMGLGAVEARDRAIHALLACGITEDMFEKSPFDLSGGQKRRAAIAGVLAMQPEILILDEPTAGLDPRGRDGILRRVKQMREKFDMTVILVSHSMEDVAALADRVVVMNNGHVAFNEIPENVFCHDRELEKIGLAAPQATTLMGGLNANGWAVNPNIFTVDDACGTIRNAVHLS